MFITNIESLDMNSQKYYICSESMSKHLIKNGFSLLSADYGSNIYLFYRTEELIKFLEEGGGYDE